MVSDTDFVKFRHNALEPKFKSTDNLLRDDLLRHSKAVFTELLIKQWMKCIYFGGIWGDMCIKMREDFALE